jgi:hypothetical protein
MYRGLTLNLLANQDDFDSVDAPSDDAVEAMAEEPNLAPVEVVEAKTEAVDGVLDDGLAAANNLDGVADNLEAASQEEDPQISPAALEALLLSLEPTRRRAGAPARALNLGKENFSGRKSTSAQRKRALHLAAEGLKEAASKGRDMVVAGIRALIDKFKELWKYLTDQDERILVKAKKLAEAAKASGTAPGGKVVDYGDSCVQMRATAGIDDMSNAAEVIKAWDEQTKMANSLCSYAQVTEDLAKFHKALMEAKGLLTGSSEIAITELIKILNLFTELKHFNVAELTKATDAHLGGRKLGKFCEGFVSAPFFGQQLLVITMNDAEITHETFAEHQACLLMCGITRIEDPKKKKLDSGGKSLSNQDVAILAQATIKHTEDRIKSREIVGKIEKNIEVIVSSMESIINQAADEETKEVDDKAKSLSESLRGGVAASLKSRGMRNQIKAFAKSTASSATRSLGAIRTLDAKMSSAALDVCAISLRANKGEGGVAALPAPAAA